MKKLCGMLESRLIVALRFGFFELKADPPRPTLTLSKNERTGVPSTFKLKTNSSVRTVPFPSAMAISMEDNSAANVTSTEPEALVIEKEFSNVLWEGYTLAALNPPGMFTVPSTWPNPLPLAGKLAELLPLAKGTLADALALTGPV